MKEVQVQQAPTEFVRLEAESALMIARSLHADLDLEAVISRLFTYTNALTSVSYLSFANEESGFSAIIGDEQPHTLSYELKLSSQTDSVGTIRLGSENPIAVQDRETIEELLSLAANALKNAHQFTCEAHQATPQVEEKPKGKKHADALVLARIDGLDVVRQREHSSMANRIMKELKGRLGESLREADGTLSVDDDHIALLLPCTATVGAQRVAEKIHVLIEGLEFVDPILRSELSVSIGISSTKDASSAAAVLASAKGQLTDHAEPQAPNIIH